MTPAYDDLLQEVYQGTSPPEIDLFFGHSLLLSVVGAERSRLFISALFVAFVLLPVSRKSFTDEDPSPSLPDCLASLHLTSDSFISTTAAVLSCLSYFSSLQHFNHLGLGKEAVK